MPSTLAIKQIRLQESGTSSRLSAVLEAPGFSQELYYDVSGCSLTVDAMPFAVAALPLAMMRGWKLRCEWPVSARWLNHCAKIQDIYAAWLPETQRIEIDAPVQMCSPRQASSGMFFSGGVDSYYTFLKNRSALQAHIFVTGFDIPLQKIALAERVIGDIRSIARAFGMHLIEVKTNLRVVSDPFMPWLMYHGAGLASVAHLMGQQLGKVYIASTHSYAQLTPLGSHPILDPLYSSESVELIHDGCEANRFQKVALLAQNSIALDTLRVCYRNQEAELNCGRCEKCLRTMVSLYALGRLEQCATFTHILNIRRIARLRVGHNPGLTAYQQQNLNALLERKDSPHLVRAVRQCMRKPGLIQQFKRTVKPLLRRSTYFKRADTQTDKQ